MVDEELLKRLRALGVKNFEAHSDDSHYKVEFFPTISPIDMDTLVPPAPAPGEELDEVKVPPAMARVLKRGSVS